MVTEIRGAVARLVINHPPLNILDIATLGELRSQFERVVHEKGVRLIEFRGAGKKAFSVGTDVNDHFPEQAAEMLRECHALIRSVWYSPLPTFAVVEGYCLGAGMELALSCDFILASAKSQFGQPEIGLGAFPPVAAVLLPRRIPEKRALELILTGKIIDAAEAYLSGMVSGMWPAQRLNREVEECEKELLAQSPEVLALARKATKLATFQNFEAALRETERIYLDELLPTEDAREGVRAFLEKRRPKWKS